MGCRDWSRQIYVSRSFKLGLRCSLVSRWHAHCLSRQRWDNTNLAGRVILHLAQILHNLLSGTGALPGSAFHKALELDRAMFAREVDPPLTHALVTTEMSVLPDTPARVATQKIGVSCG